MAGAGVLTYNWSGPREPGHVPKGRCAPLEVLTHYELDHAGPGGPPTDLHVRRGREPGRDPGGRPRARERWTSCRRVPQGGRDAPVDGAGLRTRAARTAIDGGAHAVFGHHAHICGGSRSTGRRSSTAWATSSPSPRSSRPGRQATTSAPPGRGGGGCTAPARPGDAGLSVPPGEPQHDGRGVPDRGRRVEAGFVPCWIDNRGRPVPQRAGKRR